VTTHSRLAWTTACAIGFAIGFPIFLVFTEVVFGTSTKATGFVGHLLGLALFGAVVGTCQAVVLPNITNARRWVIAGALGFALVTLVIFPLYFFGLWPTPLPVEPLVITLCAGAFAGALQWQSEGRSPHLSRWLTFWIIGLAAGVAVGAMVMPALDRFGIMPPFLPSMAIFGGLVGAVAGGVSSRAIRPSAP
jgi:hypothetical protein